MDLTGKICFIIMNPQLNLRRPAGQNLWNSSLERGFSSSSVALPISLGEWGIWTRASFPESAPCLPDVLKILAFWQSKELGSALKRKAAFGGLHMVRQGLQGQETQG